MEYNKHLDLLLNATRHKLFEYAVQSAFNHIIITDIEGKVVYANSAVERITGYSIQEIIGNTPRLWGGQMSPEFYKVLWDTIKIKKEPFHGEIINKRKTGELYHALAVISPIFDEENNLQGFIGTEEDVTKEKELQRMKTEFVSITAHQLLTPLTGIRWNLEILENQFKDKQEIEMIDNILKQNMRLMDLVKMLLNVTRIESERLTIEVTTFNLNDLISNVIKTFEKHIQIKDMQIKLETDKPEIIIQSDKSLITEVVYNLISNAIKYSPDKSEIIVELKDHDGKASFSVIDHGYGIPKDQQDKLFDKYFRASNVVSTVDGTGLGLYVVKLITKEINGEISFQSELNQGSTFTVTVPKEGLQSRKGQVSLSLTSIKEINIGK